MARRRTDRCRMDTRVERRARTDGVAAAHVHGPVVRLHRARARRRRAARRTGTAASSPRLVSGTLSSERDGLVVLRVPEPVRGQLVLQRRRGGERPGVRAAATLPFSTVLPAIASTRAWVATFPRMQALALPALPAPRALAPGAIAVGVAGLAGVGIWPDLLFPLLCARPAVHSRGPPSAVARRIAARVPSHAVIGTPRCNVRSLR